MDRHVSVGEVVGAFGVRGWVRVRSYTDPPENILGYSPWVIEGSESTTEFRVLGGRRHGQGAVAQLKGIADRDQAAALKNSVISVPRSTFPPLAEDHYYWTDLIGLEVLTPAGVPLGKITGVMETGANDVMEVRGGRDHLIPFVIGEFVKEVRLNSGFIVVDWDPEF